MRKITEIIVHCTATHPDFLPGRTTAARVQEVKRWHTKLNGWSDIGYHFLIDRDGTVVDGRPINRDGAHVRGRNAGTIGVSLFGGHGSAETDSFADNFTDAQEAALVDLIQTLQRKFGEVPVTGHNQYAAKACPGFHAPTWWAKAKRAPASDQWGELIDTIKHALNLVLKISGRA